MKSKLKIALLYGGTSNERGVSLKTGAQILKNLDRQKYAVKTYDTKTELKKLFTDTLAKKIDLCFLALHGQGGEDGTIQGLLDLLGVPYTGSSALSSAVCMDKITTKLILKNFPVPMAKDFVLQTGERVSPAITKKIKFPIVVKPSISGSSVGISIVKNFSELQKAVKEAFKHSPAVLLEECINGLEITAPVLGYKPLPLIEILPKTQFFDYQAKYEKGMSEEIVPARISPALTKKIQALALLIHEALGCSGLTRSDFILRGETPYFLEINTIPGMTETSLCPQSAKVAGISFPKLLDKIIQYSLNSPLV